MDIPRHSPDYPRVLSEDHIRFDGPVEMTRARLGGMSLRAAGNDETFDLGVTWDEFLKELEDEDSPHSTQEL